MTTHRLGEVGGLITLFDEVLVRWLPDGKYESLTVKGTTVEQLKPVLMDAYLLDHRIRRGDDFLFKGKFIDI
ncbi:MAG TPA: hypothetical protein VF598_00255 [Hymenobacter sp.]